MRFFNKFFIKSFNQFTDLTKECYAAYLATCEKMTLMLQHVFVEELLTLKMRPSV